MTDPIAAFSAFIAARGLPVPPRIIADGKIHSFSVNGKSSNDSGRYMLVIDGERAGGWLKNWGTGEEWKFTSSKRAPLTSEEREVVKARIEAENKRREAEQRKKWARCRERALKILAESTMAGVDKHPYIIRKRIKTRGFKLWKDKIVVPMYHSGVGQSVQLIDADGNKKFLTGTRLGGGYGRIGAFPKAGEWVLVCEGAATAASLHEATGMCCVIAFCAINIPVVAEKAAVRYRVLVCADNDPTGIEAAKKSGCRWIAPNNRLPPGANDFNDLACLQGIDSVREIINNARDGM